MDPDVIEDMNGLFKGCLSLSSLPDVYFPPSANKKDVFNDNLSCLYITDIKY